MYPPTKKTLLIRPDPHTTLTFGIFMQKNQYVSEYFNTRPLVCDQWILLLDKIFSTPFDCMDKMKIWKNILS